MTDPRCRNMVLATMASLFAFAASVSPAFAAAPRIMLVTGGGLAAPVVLDDWHENLAIMLAATDSLDASKEGLESRWSYRVAMFWGPTWDEYMKAGKGASALQPEQANQLARYYPPTPQHGAVFAFDSIPGPGAFFRRFESKGVAVFASHGIGSEPPNGPTQTQRTGGQSYSPPVLALLAVCGACTAVGLASAVRLGRRRNRN